MKKEPIIVNVYLWGTCSRKLQKECILLEMSVC